MSLSNELQHCALEYRHLGLSTIPVWGNQRPELAKLPAIKWADFQHRLPTVDEITHWYLERQFSGIAIVCGNISRLLVLDFDNPQYAAQFKQAFPHLQNTHIVLSASRRLPHYYFRLGMNVPSQSYSFTGLDWQCDGKYVVAPPTHLNSLSWQVVCDAPILELDLQTYQRVLEFSRNITGVTATTTHSSSTLSYTHSLSSDLLKKHYFEKLSLGRNNALYQTASLAHQTGTSLDVIMSLVQLHIDQPSPSHHPKQTPKQRMVEAIRTIHSAYRGVQGNFVSGTSSGLPNQLREYLLQRKQEALLRVLECIRNSQWLSGTLFTRQQLLELCRSFGIGDWSIRKALDSTYPDGQLIFCPAKTGMTAMPNCADAQYSLMREVTVTLPTNNRGRPKQYFYTPFWQDLLNRFGIIHRFSDNLSQQALKNPKDYRTSFHTALIARRPGRYSRQWLSQRLGITVRSLDRYHAECVTGVTRIPIIKQKVITWLNIDKDLPLLEIEEAKGVFLQDDLGKRYPPLKPIARRLLSLKCKITLCIQGVNEYCLSVLEDIKGGVETSKQEDDRSGIADNQMYPIVSIMDESIFRDIPIPNLNSLDIRSDNSLSSKQLTESDEELIAYLLQITKGTLRRKKAIELLNNYGRFAVKDACETLLKRQNKNPSGYLIRLLDQRYGQFTDEVAQAESLYTTLENYSPQDK